MVLKVPRFRIGVSSGDGGFKDHLILAGCFSPSVRAADGIDAESIAATLKTCTVDQLGDGEQLRRLFPVLQRVSESDGAGSNSKAERMWASFWPGVECLQVHCLCHRIHGISERVWSQCPRALTGATRCLLVLTSSTNMERLKAVLMAMIPARLRVIHGRPQLTDRALAFRKAVLQTWLPCGRWPRKRAILLMVTSVLLNGNWLVPGVLEHRCFGCCVNREHTVTQIQTYLGLLLDTLRTGTLCRGNWCDWSKPLGVIGVMSSIQCVASRPISIGFWSSGSFWDKSK